MWAKTQEMALCWSPSAETPGRPRVRRAYPAGREATEASLILLLIPKGQGRASTHQGQSLRFDFNFKESS